MTITGVQRQILYDKIIAKKLNWSLSYIACTIGIVVGAVFGSLAALAVAGILVWWTCRKKRHNTKGSKGKCCKYVCSQMNTSFGIIEIYLSYLSFLLGRSTIFSSLSAALWSLLKRFLYFYQIDFKTVYCERIICFVAIYLWLASYMTHDVLHSLRLNFNVYQRDFTLTNKFCLISSIYCFVLFRFFYFSVFCSFFSAEVGMSRRWDFFIEMLLSTFVVPVWLYHLNSFNTHTVFHVNVCNWSNYH